MIDTRCTDSPGCGEAAPGESVLPCLLSNNSDEHRGKLSSLDRKRAERTRQNIGHFVKKFGTAAGVLTITFPKDLGTKEAQKKRANFTRRVLKEHFGPSITVREFTKRGRPHFHAAIDCKGDISTGYNWAYHDEVTKWSKAGRIGAKPHGSLNRTALLVKLHGILNEKAPLYGLGRIELVPVKIPDAIGFYLGGYLAKSLDNKPEDAKGTRAVNYSHKCPQIITGSWSWNNESAWLWRAKLRTWATRHGCTSMAEVAALFGPKWAYHHRQSILDTWLEFYPTSKHAQLDGCEVPNDMIDITRKRSGFESVAAFRAWEARQGVPEALAALQRSVVGPPAPTPEQLEVSRWVSKYSRPRKDIEGEAHRESVALASMFPPSPRGGERPPEVSTASAGSGQAEEECWKAALDGRRLYVLRRRAAHYSPPQKARQLNLPT